MFSPSTSISLANYFIDWSIHIIIRGWYNRPAMASVIVDSVPLHPKEKKKIMKIVIQIVTNCTVYKSETLIATKIPLMFMNSYGIKRRVVPVGSRNEVTIASNLAPSGNMGK
jgi:hypothetical protein